MFFQAVGSFLKGAVIFYRLTFSFRRDVAFLKGISRQIHTIFSPPSPSSYKLPKLPSLLLELKTESIHSLFTSNISKSTEECLFHKSNFYGTLSHG